MIINMNTVLTTGAGEVGGSGGGEHLCIDTSKENNAGRINSKMFLLDFFFFKQKVYYTHSILSNKYTKTLTSPKQTWAVITIYFQLLWHHV